MPAFRMPGLRLAALRDKMAKYFFKTWIEPIKLKEMLAFELGPDYRLSVKKNTVKIVQNIAKGCQIQLKKKDDKAFCSGPYVYIPSIWLHLAWLSAYIVVLILLKKSIGSFVLATIPLMAMFFVVLSKALSQELVSKVSHIMQRLSEKT